MEQDYKRISFISSMPMINVNGVTIAIELIDHNNPNIKGLCSISVIKENKITKYNNAFIDLDYCLLYPNEENKVDAEIYRNRIGEILSDLKRNKRMMETRDGHFGVLKFDDKKGIKKYYNPEYISMMSKYKQDGLIPERYQEEGVITI